MALENYILAPNREVFNLSCLNCLGCVSCIFVSKVLFGKIFNILTDNAKPNSIWFGKIIDIFENKKSQTNLSLVWNFLMRCKFNYVDLYGLTESTLHVCFFNALDGHKFTIVSICAFLNVSSNCLSERMHNYMCCIYLTFLQCAFSNGPSN